MVDDTQQDEQQEIEQAGGDGSGFANPGGQKMAQQQGTSGTADNAGDVRMEKGEHEDLPYTSHEEKS